MYYSKNKYNASGDYVYTDANNIKQPIYFSEIKVNEDTLTFASGNVNKEKDFKHFHNFFKGVKGKHSELS